MAQVSVALTGFLAVCCLVGYAALSAALVERHAHSRKTFGPWWLRPRRTDPTQTSLALELSITLVIVVASQLLFVATGLNTRQEIGTRVISGLELLGAVAWTIYLVRSFFGQASG